MSSYVSTAIFEDAIRELLNEIVRLNVLIGGSMTSDLSYLKSNESTIVDGINDSYLRSKILQSELITLPQNCVWPIPEILQIEGLLLNDGLIIEV